MSLYIRLSNSFWNHRKTAKLRSIIGNDALWIMPKLWSYASEHQPDGNFTKYSSKEISFLIGCEKFAETIKQALIDSEYMDKDGKLHNWKEHNGYHFAYSERAKNAAEARWTKEKNKKIRQDRTGKETSIPSRMLEADAGCPSFLDIYKKYPLFKTLHDVPMLRGLTLEMWLKCIQNRHKFLNWTKAVKWVCDQAELEGNIKSPGKFVDTRLSYYEKDHLYECKQREEKASVRAKDLKEFIEYMSDKDIPKEHKTQNINDMKKQYGQDFINEAEMEMLKK